jgi:hypothetical protein
MLLALSVLLCACVAPIPSSSIIGLDKASLINQLGKPQHEGIYPEGERWDYSRGLEGISPTLFTSIVTALSADTSRY